MLKGKIKLSLFTFGTNRKDYKPNNFYKVKI